MTAISFTAARELRPEAAAGVVTNVLSTRVPRAGRYVTGGARGGDAFIGWWLFWLRPEAEHWIIVPANRSQVDPWWEDTLVQGLPTVIEMPPGTSYADRNQALVDAATWVFGFPGYPEHDPRSRYSGTWQALRMARAAGKLAEWHCVNPPYAGRIENYPDLRAAPGDRR